MVLIAPGISSSCESTRVRSSVLPRFLSSSDRVKDLGFHESNGRHTILKKVMDLGMIRRRGSREVTS